MTAGTIEADHRYLHARSEFGYTALPKFAMPSEPQALYEEDQRAISTSARTRFAEARRLDNERRDRQMWGDRLRRAEQRAADMQIDVFRYQTQIREGILGMERLLDDAA